VPRSIDSQELHRDLVVVVDPPWSTVRHPKSIFHVDESRRTAVQSSPVDSVINPTHRQLHVRARISTTSLLSVVLPVWTNYQNCCLLLLTSLKTITSQKVTLSPKVLNTWDNNVQSYRPLVTSSSLVDAMTSSINNSTLPIDGHRWLAKPNVSHNHHEIIMKSPVHQWSITLFFNALLASGYEAS